MSTAVGGIDAVTGVIGAVLKLGCVLVVLVLVFVIVALVSH